MLDLATYDNGEPVKLRVIAKRQHISEKYLEQIASVLQKASLVKSFKGAHGGLIKFTVYNVIVVKSSNAMVGTNNECKWAW